jgi:hypothetical protein
VQWTFVIEWQLTLSNTDLEALKEACSLVAQAATAYVRQPTEDAHLSCPHCKAGAFSEDELWDHLPLYHNQYDGEPLPCPKCVLVPPGTAIRCLAVHYRNNHGRCRRKPNAKRAEYESEHDLVVKFTCAFALMVCRR